MGCGADAIVTSPDGDAAVAYKCSGLSFAVRHNGSWTESTPFTDTFSGCPGFQESTSHSLGGLAIDSAGVPAAIVLRTHSEHDCSGFGFDTYQDTVILVTLSGGALAGGGTVAQGPTVLDFGSRADDVNSPSVGIGGGQVVASWSQADQNGAYHPMVRAYANNGAASPGPVEPVPGAPSSFGPRVAVSNGGTALIAFEGFPDNTNRLPYLAVRPPAGPPGAAIAAGPASSYGSGVALGGSASGDGLLAYTTGDVTAIGVRARGWDATAPQLSNVSIPGTATTGTPVAFGAQASDVWGPLSFGWDFGDGTDSGPSPSHTFTTAGARSVTVTATDAAGNSSSQSGTVGVASAFVPSRPVLSRLSLSAKTFRVGKAATAISAKVRKKKIPTGTTIRFKLDEAATVSIKIDRALPGRRRGKRCVAPTKKLTRAKRCTRYVRAGTLKRKGVAGANKVAFSGRIGKKALKPGSYRMTLVPSASSATGSSKSIAFKIVR
jgi:PKD repeat protein